MVRTRASVAAKVSSGKSSKARSNVTPHFYPGPSGERKGSSRSYVGGNPVCPRETPIWQRPITNFFQSKRPYKDSDTDGTDEELGAIKGKPRQNVIESDGEEGEAPVAYEDDTPKNTELDDSIPLEPLTGENSHKIDEYYLKKNKGKGKKTKENEERSAHNLKRTLDESGTDEDVEHPSKRTKTEESPSD